MDRTTGRKPVGNFFVKKSLQLGLIGRVIVATVVATVVAVGTIALVYYLQHKSILLYQLQESGDLSKQNILHLILPSLAISVVVNMLLAVFIGLYASRKFAVPIYKLEQWARLVRGGALGAKLRFRERNEMAGLTDEFNLLTAELRRRFAQVRTALAAGGTAEAHKDAVAMLDSMDLTESGADKEPQ